MAVARRAPHESVVIALRSNFRCCRVTRGFLVEFVNCNLIWRLSGHPAGSSPTGRVVLEQASRRYLNVKTGTDASVAALRTHTTLTRSLDESCRPIEVSTR